MDIQVVGHLCVDLVPGLNGPAVVTPGVLEETGALEVRLGGTVGNVARAVHGMGASVAVAATVGADDLGAMCRTALERDHPGAVRLTETTTSGTSYTVVLQPPGTDRTFWHHTGANDEFDGVDCELVGASFLHFGYPTLAPAMTADGGTPTVKLFQRAREQGSATSLDLAYCAANSLLRNYDWWTYFTNAVPLTDVFCPSWDDITSALGMPEGFDRARVEEMAEKFLGLGAAVVLITAGEHGSYVRAGSAGQLTQLQSAVGEHIAGWADVSGWVAPSPVEAFINTTGAGDTFKAAFLVAALDAASPVEAAQRAAAVVARHISGLPLRDA